MQLFTASPEINLLPFDGMVHYYGPVLSQKDADLCFERLLENIAWKNDEALVFGKHYVTKRKVAWYADRPYSYTYSKITKEALLWTDELLSLKGIVEQLSGESFNSCLLNLYHDGTEAMAWHSDSEKMLKRDGAIASLSFGAERKFGFRHKANKETVSLELEHGSLLMMKGCTQRFWAHKLFPSAKIKTARINLTFRTIITDQPE